MHITAGFEALVETMRPATIFVVVPFLLPMAAAQNDDPLSVFVSEAYSVYTEVTQILSSVASAATQSATDSSSAVEASTTSESPTTTTYTPSTSSDTFAVSSSSSSASTSTPHSSSATSSHISSLTPTTLSPSALGTSSVLGVTAETSTPLSTGSGTNHDHKLAIILGTVLGALAVGLLILTVLLCRRRRHGESPRHRALSPGDDEVESWRLNRQSDVPESKNSSRHALPASASGSAPLMSEHPAFRNYDDPENPFVPVPPAPRRTAPNARAGLTDGMVPGDEPFLNEKEVAVARPTSWPKGFTSSTTPITTRKDAAAAGIAGAAIGAGLMHHHQHSNHKSVDNNLHEKSAEPQVPRQIHRKPVPVNYVNNSEAWPYSPVSPIDLAPEAAALAEFPTRNSGESQRSFGRDAARANATFDQEYAPAGSGNRHHRSLDAAELAAGAAAGGALAHQHDRHQRRRSSEHTQPRSQSPKNPSSTRQRKDSNQSTSSAHSDNRNAYSDDLPTNPYHDVLAAETPSVDEPEQPLIADQHDSQPQQAFSALPPATPARSPRRDSGQGTVAPMFNYPNRPAIPSPLSSEIRPESLPKARGVNGLPSRRSRTRSGGRDRSNSRTRYSFEYDNTPFDTYPPGAGADHYGSFSAQDSRPDKGLVGDGGYPHMNVPRRGSGQYDVIDYDPAKAAPRRDSTQTPQPLPRENNTSSMMSLDGADFTPAYDQSHDFDSNWRMSSGMPSGWQRQGRRSSSPRKNDNYMRDSGIAGIGGSGPKEGRRLRASDLAGGDRYPQMGLGQAL
ncbi:hypothetical protein LTR93_008650 [Exophiala xenobiotica]|nr:hypothetical protein LTR93_008650 [Exophiala xenobiotica]